MKHYLIAIKRNTGATMTVERHIGYRKPIVVCYCGREDPKFRSRRIAPAARLLERVCRQWGEDTTIGQTMGTVNDLPLRGNTATIK